MMTPQEIWEQRPQFLIVTGEMGAGKTTWIQHFIDYARSQQAVVCGLISPAIIEDGIKTGIALVDLATGEQHQLAWQRTNHDDICGIMTRRWRFDPEVLAWGDAMLRDIIRTDVLVIDEIGPLELEYGEGWQSALTLLDSPDLYTTACVVIRPTLVPPALSRWPQALLLEYTSK